MKVDFKAMLKNVSTTANEHKPEIMTGLGLALMIGSTVASVVATVKTMKKASEIKEEKLLEIASNADEYEELSDEDQQKYDDILDSPVPMKELGKHVWKYWIAPFAGEIVGSALLIGSNRESAKRIGSLAAALAYHVAEATDYKEAAKEILGEKKEKEVEEKVEKKRVEEALKSKYPKNVIDTGMGNDLFYDYYNDRFFLSSFNYIQKCINELNADHISSAKNDPFDYNPITLRQFYEQIHLGTGEEYKGFGDEFGWLGLIELDMSNDNAKMSSEGILYWVLRFKRGTGGLDYLKYPI